jgi:hypothetical protein
MAFELEGNFALERSPTRRWVSIVAVVIPVASFVMLAGWFIRVFVVPPTITIPSPMMVASVAPPAPAVPARLQAEAPRQQQPQTVGLGEPARAPRPSLQATEGVPMSALPMFATLAVAPPSLPSASSAYAETAQDASPPTGSVAPASAPKPSVVASAAEPAASEIAEPMTASVPLPLPRAKHRSGVALANAVPLPRPRPTESLPSESDLPVFDRHAVE